MAKKNKQEIEKYRKLLNEAKLKIASDLHQLEKDTLSNAQRDAAGDLSGYSVHMADQATDNFDIEFNLGLAEGEQKSLNLIEAALRKLDDGTYGVCEDCSKVIPQKRLQAVPQAALCIKCQEAKEKEQRGG